MPSGDRAFQCLESANFSLIHKQKCPGNWPTTTSSNGKNKRHLWHNTVDRQDFLSSKWNWIIHQRETQYLDHLPVYKLTRLTTLSVCSKWRPIILGASPPVCSILMHTSWPFLPTSNDLWLNSMLVTWPRNTNSLAAQSGQSTERQHHEVNHRRYMYVLLDTLQTMRETRGRRLVREGDWWGKDGASWELCDTPDHQPTCSNRE